MNILISLFDYTGNWARPYKEAGWTVHQVDIKLGIDILTWNLPLIFWSTTDLTTTLILPILLVRLLAVRSSARCSPVLLVQCNGPMIGGEEDFLRTDLTH